MFTTVNYINMLSNRDVTFATVIYINMIWDRFDSPKRIRNNVLPIHFALSLLQIIVSLERDAVVKGAEILFCCGLLQTIWYTELDDF